MPIDEGSGPVVLRIAIVSLTLSCYSSWAQAQTPQKPSADLETAELATEAAKTIFATSDANRNHWLSRNELPKAIDQLDQVVSQWGQQGMLGRPRKQSAKQKDESHDALAAIEQLTARLSKNTRVSEAEFTLYVQNVVQEADEHYRQLRAMSEAQRKAYNAYRASLRPRRGRIVSGYPIPSF